MSIFGNMLGAYDMGKNMVDSFQAGTDDIERALIEQGVPLQSPANIAEGTRISQVLPTQLDETQMAIGTVADGNVGEADGGNWLKKFATGDSMAGNLARIFGGF